MDGETEGLTEEGQVAQGRLRGMTGTCVCFRRPHTPAARQVGNGGGLQAPDQVLLPLSQAVAGS